MKQNQAKYHINICWLTVHILKAVEDMYSCLILSILNKICITFYPVSLMKPQNQH